VTKHKYFVYQSLLGEFHNRSFCGDVDVDAIAPVNNDGDPCDGCRAVEEIEARVFPDVERDRIDSMIETSLRTRLRYGQYSDGRYEIAANGGRRRGRVEMVGGNGSVVFFDGPALVDAAKLLAEDDPA
jgi:hypothetical protein